MRRHYERLTRSATTAAYSCSGHLRRIPECLYKVDRALYERDKDMWIRATLYVVEGHWGEGTVADLVLTAYHQAKQPSHSGSVGVSTWQTIERY